MAQNLDDLFETHDALGLGERVAAGEVSAAEVTAAGRARIARVDAELGAVSREMEAGRAASGPFQAFRSSSRTCSPTARA